MNIVEACKLLLANKKLAAKRKHWVSESVKIFEIGWASNCLRRDDTDDSKSKNPKDYFLQHIINNRLAGIGHPELDDIMANDWEVFED